MKFIADLHIHSKYSRATAKNLDLENLYYAAQIKGIRVVGTGDFTFPAWIDEIETKLEPAEPGLFRLKPKLAAPIDKTIPEKCKAPVRFILQTEISNIYKRDDRVRKNHNLIYFPDIRSVKQFNARLDAIGNIKSDGRPILGLDAADLLKIMLDTNDDGFFVPAHIWTPWFSMFGSKSGFDSIEACFGPLKKHIFAVETGLSSDPPMNWRIQDLDNVRLISSSDAHSPGYLGRNASVFDTDLSFHHIRNALEKNDLKAFCGTLDMYPHQGKYHYDGHRKCNVCLNPAATAELDGICPECGKKVTCGVLNRVQELATRPEGYQPENRHGFKSIIPLADMLAQIFQVGPKTKKVTTYYQKAIEQLGPELDILLDRSLEEIKTSQVPLLAEAIEKMRSGNVRIDPGYDGEFGQVHLFTRQEKEVLQGERYPLFDLPKEKKITPVGRISAEPEKPSGKIKKMSPVRRSKALNLLQGLNPEQQRAVDSDSCAMVIQAGPGTGKTLTLTAKIASLISKKGVEPSSILALTFTNKAARELAHRIQIHLLKSSSQPGSSQPLSGTFHSFCLKLLKQYQTFNAAIADDTLRLSFIRMALGDHASRTLIKQVDLLISHCKQRLLGPEDDLSTIENSLSGFSSIYQAYQALCKEQNVADFEDLIFLTVKMLTRDGHILAKVQQQYQYIFVDEYQDLNFGQYELIKILAQTGNLVVIGDPDQSIYGFRGSDNRYFKDFSHDFPGCERVVLNQNYRSTQTILDASFQMISHAADADETVKIFATDKTFQKLIIKETASEYAEAVAIGKMIEQLVGGTSFFSMDAGKTDMTIEKEYSFSDFAVLYRTRKEADVFVKIFEKEGIPYQVADKNNWFKIDIIQDLISLCRILTGEQTHLDTKRIFLLFGAGQARKAQSVEEKIRQLKASIDGQNNDDAIIKIVQACDPDKMIENNARAKLAVEKIIHLAGLYDDLDSFLEALSLNQDVDTIEFEVEQVSLMTMHAAKGLEFPVVFVAGCEQGLIPFARNGKIIDNIEEERRLFYVAMTRAMEILCLTYAKKRSIYGIGQKRQRSFFIEDIEKQLMKIEKMPARKVREEKQIQLELF
ncbi:MAG: UvrD-helicase domain-containing protein [Pseudomonadota bacterium]